MIYTCKVCGFSYNLGFEKGTTFEKCMSCILKEIWFDYAKEENLKINKWFKDQPIKE